jgi:hypothetical protein
VGSGGVIPLTTMNKIILLKRDMKDEKIATRLSDEQALEYMLSNEFCNPHQLVKDSRKLELRRDFFLRYFKQTSVHLVNTIATPEETQQKIREIVSEE